MTSTGTVLRAESLHKTYRMGREDLQVLRGVDLSIPRGQWLCILGASGSGKSTLLHLMGGLDSPDSGKVYFNSTDLFAQGRTQLDRYRNRHVGFVFQFYHLLPELNVLENVLVSSMVGRSVVKYLSGRAEQRRQAAELLGQIGLGDRLKHRPRELSGGERQRVAIARALINKPDVLLADEPTGNLDRHTGQTSLQLLSDLHGRGQTIVMVTHDPVVAQRADRVLQLESGKLVNE